MIKYQLEMVHILAMVVKNYTRLHWQFKGDVKYSFSARLPFDKGLTLGLTGGLVY